MLRKLVAPTSASPIVAAEPATTFPFTTSGASVIVSPTVVPRYPAGSDPEQFAVSPAGRRLYVANEDAGASSIIDLRKGTLISTEPVGVEPEGVAISPNGRSVYVTAETSSTVSVTDTRTNAVVATFLA